ncbi:MAG: threonine synthase [Burkholderiaceae bacterium]|nr:threonine synthase [Burkholderiaceae bacterium]MCD8516378.1 threonine synthase [Burkholderiaceae bacterium]MCD8538224.1 threonine synthase [Burkholderiaceae bacterium]MCD8565762.1 threonine synthase [Burkholderiaceae bacterium]
MKYVSTRGAMHPQLFQDVLLEGLAPDGGLAVPESLPVVSTGLLESWRSLTYPQLAAELLGYFVTDIESADLLKMTTAAYSPTLFRSESIVDVRELNQGMSLLAVSEGPTLAFKDIAMQFLGQVFPYVLKARGTTLNILGATSGDTGSAAEYAMRSKPGVAVFMLSPHGRMSSFQRAQMYSLMDDNIHNLAVRGVFDEAQDIVKALAGDLDFKQTYRLGAVNSINWARIAAQIVYYFWGWLRATSGPSQQVSFAVPSGNFGNILSGHIAKRMGLPIRRLVLATNENNVLEEFFRTGVYRPRLPAQTHATSSPSMDISRASNFERFVYDLLDGDAARVKSLWQQLAQEGQFDLSDHLTSFERDWGFVAGVSSHDNRLATIRRVFDETGMLIDPHTADGVKVAAQYVESGIPMLVLETALPAKFSETIEQALGRPAPRPPGLEDLESRPQRVVELPCDVASVRDYIKEHAKV